MILESSKRTAGIFLIYLYMFSRLRSQPVQSCGFRGDIVIEILPVSAAEQFAYDMTVPEDQNAVRKAGGIGVMCDHKDRGLEFTVRFAQSIQQFRGRRGVESARGLIGKQDIRPFYDGSAADRRKVRKDICQAVRRCRTVPRAAVLRRQSFWREFSSAQEVRRYFPGW